MELRSAFNALNREECVGLAASHLRNVQCPALSPLSDLHAFPAFISPHFLLLLKEIFSPASLLDHAWQKAEDLLKMGDNEQKQEDRLWRKSRPGGKLIHANLTAEPKLPA